MGSYANETLLSAQHSRVVQVSQLFGILSEPNRMLLLSLLEFGSQTVSELVLQSQLSQSLVSHHLKDLRELEIVSASKQKQWVYYQLTQRGQQVMQLVHSLGA